MNNIVTSCRLVVFLLLLWTGIGNAISQVMVTPTGKPASLIVCHEDGTFSLQIANTSGSTMTGATLMLDLPPGVRYTPGSVTSATELDITNLNQPVFLLPDILNNTALAVTYDAALMCGYTNTVNFVYIVTWNSNTYTGTDTPLLNYYYPEPVITNITNANATIPVNSTVIRDITIQQQGVNSTLDTLILLDEHTSDIQILSVSLGTLHPYIGPGPMRVDTIIITGNDFPGGNQMFDAGESIIVSETVKLVGCTNGQSTLKASWGCWGQTCAFSSAFPTVSPAAGTTVISIAFTSNRLGWGFIDNSGFTEMTVTNNGTGAGTAFNLVLLSGFSSGGSTYYPNSDWINEIDSFSVNGNYLAASYNYAAGALNGQYAYYTTFQYPFDPDGPGVGLDDADGDGFFDDLPVGKTITVRAHTYYDWAEALSKIPTGKTCGSGWTNSAWQAFRYGYQYLTQCSVASGVNWLANGNLLQFQTYNTVTTQHTIPPDIFDGTTVWMEHTVTTSTSVDNDGCPNDSVIYELVLPKGIVVGPGIATFKGVSMGAPFINGDTVVYYLDKSRVLTGGMFRVPLTPECEVPHNPTGTISVKLKFWCDKTFHRDRYFTYWCSTSPVFGIQCQIGDCPDPSISLFDVKRTTLGWTNNQLTARVTSSTPGLRLYYAMARDSIKITAAGKANGTVDSLYFQLRQDNIAGNWSNKLFFDFVTDTLRFFDVETSTWYNCSGLSPQIINGATSYLKTYFGNLTQSGNCLEGLNFSAGDSLYYVIYGVVKNIAQTEWKTVPAFRAQFHWRSSGNDLYCNDRGVTFNILGANYPFIATTFYQQIVLQGCSTFVYEGLINRTLEVCGGDIAFPSEIRPHYVLDTMIFTLPEGFVYLTGSARHGYNLDNGNRVNEVISDPVIQVGASGTILTFIRTPSWSYSDYYDCWEDLDRITFSATPSCKATDDYSYGISAKGRYQFYYNGTGIPYTSSSSKSIDFTPPLVNLTRLITTAEGREDTIMWKIRLCNAKSFVANNNWIGLESGSAGIQITSIRDVTNPSSPVVIPFSTYGPGKYWAQIGTISGNACPIYEIKATYTICSFDSLKIRHGYNCATMPLNPDLGYPPSGYQCSENSSWLYLDPKDISLNNIITSPSNPVDLCDTLEYEVQMTNSQLSNAYYLKLTVSLPPGVEILQGLTQFKYPYTTGNWVSLSNPVNNPSGSNKWVYDISGDTNGVVKLKGVDSIPKNGYLLRFRVLTNCDFISGTSIRIISSATNACGDEKTRTSDSPQILINGLPSNVNLYVISTLIGPVLFTCSDPSLVKIKVINLGPSSVSQIEKLGIVIDDAYDYVPNSLVGIHNGPSGVSSNIVIGGIRYLNFSIEPNLPVNDSIVFTFELEDIDPANLVCDTLTIETSTLLVAKVPCSLAPGDSCLIYSKTSTIYTDKPVAKDNLSFGGYNATSVPFGTSGETITLLYRIRNTGSDTLHTDTVHVILVHDANLNGIADETGADSLYFQDVPVINLLPGDSVSVQAVFAVSGDKICSMLASIRRFQNGCICNDITLPVNNIRLFNAGPDIEVCVQTSDTLGLPATTGYSYIWVPGTYLNSYTVAQPVFLYPGIIFTPDTLTHVLTTTRPGNCISRDTMWVALLPVASANAGPDTTVCYGMPYYLIAASAMAQQSVFWSTSGTGTFNNPTLINPIYTASAGDYASGSVTLTMSATGYCGNDVDAMVLNFQPNATVYAGKDTAICETSAYQITDATATNYSGLIWSTTGDGSFSNTFVLNPIYFPGPGDTLTGYTRLILQANGLTWCPSVKDTMLLILNPSPIITNSPLQKSICSGQSTNIVLTSSQPGTIFTWTASLILGSLTGFGPGNGVLIADTLINNDTVEGKVQYLITPDNTGCIGQSKTYEVTVKPVPVLTTTPLTQEICSGDTLQVTLSSNISGTTFSWTAMCLSGMISGYSGGNGNLISQPLYHSGFVTDSVTYSIIPSLNGCQDTATDYQAMVKPLPDLSNNPPQKEICTGSSTNIILQSHVTGTLFTWTATSSSPNVSGYFDNLTTPDTLIDQTLTTTGTNPDTVKYHVVPHAGGCNGIVWDFTVIVHPEPALSNPILFQAQCDNLNTGISLQSPVAGTTFTWRAFTPSANLTGFSSNPGPGSAMIDQNLNNTGFTIDTVIYRILPEAAGCPGDSTDYRVAVYPVPDLSNNPVSTTICNGASTNVSLTSNVPGTLFTWTCSQPSGNITGWMNSSVPEDSIIQQLVNISLVTDSVVYHLMPHANGCDGVNTDFTVYVYPLPDVYFDPPAQTICHGSQIGIQILSHVPGATFSWTSSASSPLVSGYASGSGAVIQDTIYNPGLTIETVTYTVIPEAFGCPPGIPQNVVITVNPKPSVVNTVRTFSQCNQQTTNIQLQSSLSYPTVFSWTAAGSSPLVTGFANGTGSLIAQLLVNTGFENEWVIYQVVPESNGCVGDTAIFTVTVFPVPDIWFVPAADTICSGQSTGFVLQSHVNGAVFSWTATGGSPLISGFFPGSGDTIQQTLQTTAFVPGWVSYEVTPAANGCIGIPSTTEVIVKPSPFVIFPVCFDTVTTTDAQPIRLKGGIPPGGIYSGPGVSNGYFYPNLAGTGTKTITYSYTNYALCSASAQSLIHSFTHSLIPCGQPFTDIRDGKTYQTVQIGSQCWFAENLDYGTEIPENIHQRDNCLPEKYVRSAFSVQGSAFYQWDEIMQYDDTPGLQGLCPPGWHVPIEADWNILFSNWTNNAFAGAPLKYTGYSGFNAFLNGTAFFNNGWYFNDFATFFWSSTPYGSYKAWSHGMNEYNYSVSFYPSFRSNAFSVRCLRD